MSMRRKSCSSIIFALGICLIMLLPVYAKETTIIMKLGEKKSVVFDAKESVRFQFHLPKDGIYKFSLSSQSDKMVELNMGGMMNALIKKGQPMVMGITRDAKNPKPTKQFVNMQDKKTSPITVELSEMVP